MCPKNDFAIISTRNNTSRVRKQCCASARPAGAFVVSICCFVYCFVFFPFDNRSIVGTSYTMNCSGFVIFFVFSVRITKINAMERLWIANFPKFSIFRGEVYAIITNFPEFDVFRSTSDKLHPVGMKFARVYFLFTSRSLSNDRPFFPVVNSHHLVIIQPNGNYYVGICW